MHQVVLECFFIQKNVVYNTMNFLCLLSLFIYLQMNQKDSKDKKKSEIEIPTVQKAEAKPVEQSDLNTENSDWDTYKSSLSTIVPVKNMFKLIGLTIIAGLGPMYVGFLLYIGFIANFASYRLAYNIPDDISDVLGTSMILSVVPLGGVLSAMFLPDVLKHTNKRYFFLQSRDVAFVFLIASVVFCGITCIPNFIPLMIGRFFLGSICAWQNSMGATLIRDLSPIQYRQMCQSIFFVTRTFGMAFCFMFSQIFSYELTYSQFCILGCVPAMMCIVQVICVKLFIPILPGELVAKNKIPELKAYYSDFYASQHVDQAVENCIREFKEPAKMFSYINEGKSDEDKQLAAVIFNRMQRRGLFISLYATAIRQLCGTNYVVFYGNIAWFNAGFSCWQWGTFAMSLVQFVGGVFGLFFTHKIGRRPLFLIGGLISIAGAFTMAVCDFQSNYIGVVVGQVIYIFTMSSSTGTLVWPYPIETIPPSQTKWSSLVNWTAAFLITIVPLRPSSFEFFFAIGVYMVLSEILGYLYIFQTRRLTLREVITRYMQESYEIIANRVQMAKRQGRFTRRISLLKDLENDHNLPIQTKQTSFRQLQRHLRKAGKNYQLV